MTCTAHLRLLPPLLNARVSQGRNKDQRSCDNRPQYHPAKPHTNNGTWVILQARARHFFE